MFEGKKEIAEIIEAVAPKKTTNLYKKLSSFLTITKPIIVIRNLDSKTYTIKGLDIDKEKQDTLAEEIISSAPYLLYFDDFTDRVPEKIVFPANYGREDSDPFDNKTDWHEYLSEIFLRATDTKIIDFLHMERGLERQGLLSDIQDTLNQEIIKGWERLKILKNTLRSEMSALKILLDYGTDSEGNHIFSFQVEDKTCREKGRFFTINERSKGFQWFFNFAIKLKFNINYVNEVAGAIYLLDEPGSYLHSSAQEELLKSLSSISKTNKVIYCSHSQYLLNPDIINVSGIKVAVRKSSTIKIQNFGQYEEVNRLQGALSPLYDALQLHVGHRLSIKESCIVVTEGIIDHYFLDMARKYIRACRRPSFTLIPGAGADNLKDLISFSIAWSKKYVLLLDSDSKGIDAFEKYEKYFDKGESCKWILYSLPNKNNKVKLEDFMSDKDKERLKKLVGDKSIKKGIIALYFSKEDIKKEFYRKLNRKSLENIGHLFRLISTKVKEQKT
jgi:predicted ATP-dependent endonuclease of OLD family